MWRCVDEAKEGRMFEATVRVATQPKEGLRHPEYESDPDDDLCDEWNWLSDADEQSPRG